MFTLSCSLIPIPEIVSFDSIEISEKNQHIQLESKLLFYNTSWIPVKSDSVVFKVFLDSNQVALGNIIGAINFPRHDSSYANINIELLSDLDDIFLDLDDEFDISLRGCAVLPICKTPYYFEKNYHLKKDNLIDLAFEELMSDNAVRITSFKIKQVTMFNTEIQFNVLINNPVDVLCTLNNFNVKIFRDSLLLNEVGVVNEIDEIILNNYSETKVVIDASVNNLSMISSAFGKVNANQFSFFLLINTDVVVGNNRFPIEFKKAIEFQ